jgi:pSer/pThr/pTyr-binding forkhead associated (FHA) protein
LPDDETTASLALMEERHDLEDEFGDLLDDLPPGMGVLVVRRGPGAGSRYALEQETTTLGRHPDSDIFLDDITVSRRHAVVTRLDDGYEVKDAGSLNGTYVNHERVETARLMQFNELQIGRFVLTFVEDDDEP